MKKMSKALLLVVCAVLLVATSVMGTLAYLTHTTDAVTNTFTIGSVLITLDETDVDVYGVKDGETRVKENTYKLIPGREYVKDPKIHVDADSENCWVFIKMNNGLGTAASITIDTANWTKIEETADGVVYAYNAEMEAGKSTTALFSSFTFASDADPKAYEGKTITLIGYAVQRQGLNTAKEAWDASFGA